MIDFSEEISLRSYIFQLSSHKIDLSARLLLIELFY